MPEKNRETSRLGEEKQMERRPLRKRRKILVVDDDPECLAFVSDVLKNHYEVLTAADGQEGLNRLYSDGADVSLILLDMIMPVIDGFQFLEIQRKDPRISIIPTIVTTTKDSEENEKRCLELGAMDFVSKPYNPELLMLRVDQIIRLQETASMLHAVERDYLTGLYSKEVFALRAEQCLRLDETVAYDMVVADVENFKVINERYGLKVGDRVLCHLADQFRKLIDADGLLGRMHSDVFVMMVPHGEGSWKKRLLWQWDEPVDGIPVDNLVIKYGIYEKVNRGLPVFGMIDRAMLAMNRVKRRYGVNVAMYDDSLRAHLLREQQILDSMEQALEEHQFQVYYQPKYDVYSGHVSGAEALVRWNHPSLGFLSPGEFIPLFERNGFISRLDAYVREETCASIRKWLDEGRHPVPVSVNLSRVDFLNPKLEQELLELIRRYRLETDLLHLEITESAYMEEPDSLIQMVTRLRELGFKVEMDDFGTAYSSLNILSELPIDVLKLDMRFIQEESGNEAKNSILGFVISLSKWLNLETVAEGVETKEQVDQLKRLGCNYVQGYYYAKPMIREEFERCLDEDRFRENHAEPKKQMLTANLMVPSDQNRFTVLIVDDSKINREILRDIIDPYYWVKEASNGQEAYDFLMEYPGTVDLILLDMVMPVMDGFQFMRLRNEDDRLAQIPVIMTSAQEADCELIALRLGADRFVGKPYREELLLLSIRQSLRGAKRP